LGTLEDQWIKIHLKEGSLLGGYPSIHIPIPSASHQKAVELKEFLQKTLERESQRYLVAAAAAKSFRKRRSAETAEFLIQDGWTDVSDGAKTCFQKGKKFKCIRNIGAPDEIEAAKLPKLPSAEKLIGPAPSDTQESVKNDTTTIPKAAVTDAAEFGSMSTVGGVLVIANKAKEKTPEGEVAAPAEFGTMTTVGGVLVIANESKKNDAPKEIKTADEGRRGIPVIDSSDSESETEKENEPKKNEAPKEAKNDKDERRRGIPVMDDSSDSESETEKKQESPPKFGSTDKIGGVSVVANDAKKKGIQEVNNIPSHKVGEKDKKVEASINESQKAPVVHAPPAPASVSESALKATPAPITESAQEERGKQKEEKLYDVEEGEEEEFPLTKELSEMIRSIQVEYMGRADRFKIGFSHEAIDHLSISEQLAYVLGLEERNRVTNGQLAKYGSDLTGGFSSFVVYAKGLTEEVIMGNTVTSLLQIVAVEDHKPGSIVHKIYDSPMFIRVMPREINEIEIELRTITGDFVPFQYGTVMVTLVFKKVINF
jgi:hypothetical protein